jgi:hypothetical protein
MCAVTEQRAASPHSVRASQETIDSSVGLATTNPLMASNRASSMTVGYPEAIANLRPCTLD